MTQTQKITSENIHAKMLAIREKRNAQVAECTYTTPESVREDAQQDPENLNYHFEWGEISHQTLMNDPVHAKIAGIIKARLDNKGVFCIFEYGVEFLAYYEGGKVRWNIQCGDVWKVNEQTDETDNAYHIRKLTDAILCLKIANYSINHWLDMAETFVDDTGDIAENMLIVRGRQMEEYHG